VRVCRDTRSRVDDVRVALIDMSLLLRGILRGLVAREPDMSVVAEYPNAVPLSVPVEEHDAQVLVFGDLGTRLEDQCRELLEAHPSVKLFLVADDGRRTTLCELRPHREQLGELDPDQFVALMRNAAARAVAMRTSLTSSDG
jgi:DNA-binding NarL/FixJ family response regulator